MGAPRKQRMIKLDAQAKIWITITLCTLFCWTLYYMADGLTHFVNIIQGIPDFYTGKEWYFIPGFLGITGRLIGVSLGLSSAFLVWMKQKDFSAIKNLVLTSLVLEALYFISLLPSFWSLAIRNLNSLAAAYLLQTLLIAPSLITLAIKTKNHVPGSPESNLAKWVALAFAGYIAALWINVVLRWTDMFAIGGLQFLLTGIMAIGFLDAIVIMSLALILALTTTYYLIKQNRQTATKFLGLTLTAVGLHYLIYMIYAYLAEALGLAFLIDVWTIPLIGAGLSILRISLQKNNNQEKDRTIKK